MKIINHTKWNTSDLRNLFARCIWEVKKIEGRGKNIGIKIELKNNNAWDERINGRAYIGWYKMMIKIGVKVDLTDIKRQKELALLFIHEYYHNLGCRSQDGKNYENDWTERYDVSFVKDYQIRLAEVKAKVKVDLQMERYQKVLRYVKIYQSKAKRVQNLLKKWRQKKRRYEKILVAAGKIKSE